LAEMVAGYHPDAEIDFSRTLPDFPATGGVEAMSGWVESARGMFTDVRLEPSAIIDAGDVAMTTMRVTGTGGMSGAPVDAEIFYVFRFRDGLVIAATTYMTEQEALKAVGLAE
jgi:ketosteroid isomerase-like protein